MNLAHGFYWLDSNNGSYPDAWYFVFNTGFMHEGNKLSTAANARAVHDVKEVIAHSFRLTLLAPGTNRVSEIYDIGEMRLDKI